MICHVKFVLLIFLVCIKMAKSKNIVCERVPGDSLLSSQSLFQVSIMQEPRIRRIFVGHRITCVEANLPLGLNKVLSLSILEGGVGCDFVGLQISAGKLLTVGVGLNIYGVKANSDELDDLNCKSQGSTIDGVRGLQDLLQGFLGL